MKKPIGKIGLLVLDKLQQDIIKEIRSQFVKMSYLSKSSDGRVCIGLSGGVDSTLIGLVGQHIGLEVVAISYEREGHISPDMKQAEKTCKILGWELHKVTLPKDDPKKVFLSMVNDYQCQRKTEIECLYPYLPIFDKAKELGFDKLMVGFNTTPDGRKDSIKIGKDPSVYWSDIVSRSELYREPSTNKTPRISNACTKLYEIGKKKDIRVVAPMFGGKYNSLFLELGLTTKQMNTPHQKSFLKKCFPDEFEKIGMTKTKNLNLQKGGGMEEFFEPIIHDPEINFRDYKIDTVTNVLSRLAKLHFNVNPKKKKRELRSKDSHSDWLRKNIPSKLKDKDNPKDSENTFGRVVKFKPYQMNDVIKQSNKKLFSVVSTFAGGGGSSTGYRLAGGNVLLVNEFVDEAIRTYSKNFPDTPIDTSDIREITRSGKGKDGVLEWLKSFKIKDYDILDGSPPCSTFSSVGKGEEKSDKKNVQYSDVTQDRIGYLIHEWVYLANCSLPKIAILENVPEIQTSPIFKNAITRLKRDYLVNWKELTSSNYGVPQKRKRLFVVGIRNDIAKKLGIETEDDILELYPETSSYNPTVYDALHDLELDEDEVNLTISATKKSSVYEVVKNIKTDPERVWRLNYSNRKFKNLYFNTNRCSWYLPAPTLTQLGAQLGGLGGIYHPMEHRTFTIKELKRLTGLPDDFELTGSFNQRAERIGRMVPPLMTKELASSLYEKVLKNL